MTPNRARTRMAAVSTIAALACLWTAAAPAAAHTQVPVSPYTFTVGWESEPAVVGVANAVTVAIVANNTTAVEGADADLAATLLGGGQSSVRALEASDEVPGLYRIALIPTRGGTYSVRIAGTLNGTAVNFTAALDSPEPADEYEFPATDPSPSDLQRALDDAQAALAREQSNATALAARVAALEGGGSGAACGAGGCGQSTAMLIGSAGLAAGVVGIAIGAVAVRRGRAPK